MAQVFVKTEVVKKQTVTLELSQEEAEWLHQVLRKIGGHEIVSPRKFADEIIRQLKSSGINYSEYATDNTYRGSIHFEQFK